MWRGSTGRKNGQRGLTWKGCEGGKGRLAADSHENARGGGVGGGGGGKSRSRSAGSLHAFTEVGIRGIRV